MFYELIEEYSDISFEEESLNRIIQFQIEKAKCADASRYSVKDALNNQEGGLTS